MTSYSVACAIQATDNDHFKLAELRIAEPYIPQFVTGLRALETGTINVLCLFDAEQKVVITGEGLTTYTVMFEHGCCVYMCEEDLYELEKFALERLFDKQKPSASLTLQLSGEEEDIQTSLTVWIGEKEYNNKE